MWQMFITIAVVLAALIYVVRSLTRSAKGRSCAYGAGTCSLARNRQAGSLPCQNVQQAISAESLEESARNLGRKDQPNRQG